VAATFCFQPDRALEWRRRRVSITILPAMAVCKFDIVCRHEFNPGHAGCRFMWFRPGGTLNLLRRLAFTETVFPRASFMRIDFTQQQIFHQRLLGVKPVLVPAGRRP
jgi:hypothetical protein